MVQGGHCSVLSLPSHQPLKKVQEIPGRSRACLGDSVMSPPLDGLDLEALQSQLQIFQK